MVGAEYINISTATASRDLLAGVKADMLRKQGEKNQVQYQFFDLSRAS